VATRHTSRTTAEVLPRADLLCWRWVAVVMARKKRSAKGGGGARKRVVTPPNAIRRGEIVEEIADCLQPWKQGTSAADVSASVNHELDALLIIVPFQWESYDRPRNRAHAKQLDSALTNVETLLASAPRALADLWLHPVTIVEDDKQPQAALSSIRDMVRAYRNRTDSFVAELNRLHALCSRFIDQEFGPHTNYDHAKHMSAKFAFLLMKGLSDRKITGTENGRFRTITNLLYEAITGEPDADLKRACDSVLAEIRDTQLGTDQAS
jgi:hypothetical protein